MTFTRRQALVTPAALTAGLAAGLGFGMPRRAFAAAPRDRKFIFVFARGGWDPTRVFADGFDNSAVSMEEGAERATVGELGFIDHPDRPSVRAFFEANAASTVVLQGLMVRSIAHDICTRISMTGTTSGTAPDWAAVIADSSRDSYVLPHMVLGGPSFPGTLGVAVARTGSAGQLDALVSGDSLQLTDTPLTGLSRPSESLVDRWVARRATARAASAGTASAHTGSAALTTDFAAALAHARELKDLQWLLDFGSGGSLLSQASVAVDALSLGVARCVTLQAEGGAMGWDTHAQNDDQQSPLWEGLFAGLAQLRLMLETTPGTTTPTLADETLVVVLSEMGRTPMLNAFLGKDHWPFTSMMLFGDGIVGGRSVGGWDSNWYGRTVDPATGELSDDGAVLSAESLGATLLALADLDPEATVSGVSPLQGVLA